MILVAGVVGTVAAATSGGGAGQTAATPAPSELLTAEDPGLEDQPDVVLCQGNEVPVQALQNPRPASQLAPDAAPALNGRYVSQFDPFEWLIAQESDDRVMLMQKLPVPDDHGQGDIREYGYIVISTDSMPAAPGESEWVVVESSTCSPTLDLGELRAGAVTLDPSSPPAPGSDRLALLVTELECNSGQDAVGRVELVRLAETELTVELVIGVRPSGKQEATCQGNPATPNTVDLERPLGDRVILNAAVVPAREITAVFSDRDPLIIDGQFVCPADEICPGTVVIPPPDVMPPLSPTLPDACPDNDCVLVEE